MSAQSPTADREIVTTRLLSAPRELVYKAWTDPHHIVKWWGPRGFTTTTSQMDARPGGEWRFVMHGPDGTDYPNHIRFRELVAPERIVYDHVSGPRFHVVTTLETEGDKTRLTMRATFESAKEREATVKKFGAIEGAQQTVERLEEYLAAAVIKPFVITRVINAPRTLVWNAWTREEQLLTWWGPKGFKGKVAKLDLRAGGIFHYGMEAPNGVLMWGKWVFREVSAPHRLVFVASFSDAQCGVARHPMSPNYPLESLSTVTFTESNGKTTLTIEGTPLNASPLEREAFEAVRSSLNQGWGGTLEQLESHLLDVVITRVIKAPRELVWKAWTDPTHFAKWWGPGPFTAPICEMDVRPGGAFRWVMRSPEGVDYPMTGEYREVTPPSRLVYAMDLSHHPANWQELLSKLRHGAAAPDEPPVATVTFEDLDGDTRLTIRTRFGSATEARAYTEMRMADGWSDCLDKLETVTEGLSGTQAA